MVASGVIFLLAVLVLESKRFSSAKRRVRPATHQPAHTCTRSLARTHARTYALACGAVRCSARSGRVCGRPERWLPIRTRRRLRTHRRMRRPALGLRALRTADEPQCCSPRPTRPPRRSRSPTMPCAPRRRRSMRWHAPRRRFARAVRGRRIRPGLAIICRYVWQRSWATPGRDSLSIAAQRSAPGQATVLGRPTEYSVLGALRCIPCAARGAPRGAGLGLHGFGLNATRAGRTGGQGLPLWVCACTVS